MSDVRALPPVVHDPESLFTARWAIRDAYTRIQRLRQVDPTIRDLLNTLDDICIDLTNEIASIEPEIQFRSVRVIQIAAGEVS